MSGWGVCALGAGNADASLLDFVREDSGEVEDALAPLLTSAEVAAAAEVFTHGKGENVHDASSLVNSDVEGRAEQSLVLK